MIIIFNITSINRIKYKHILHMLQTYKDRALLAAGYLQSVQDKIGTWNAGLYDVCIQVLATACKILSENAFVTFIVDKNTNWIKLLNKHIEDPHVCISFNTIYKILLIKSNKIFKLLECHRSLYYANLLYNYYLKFNEYVSYNKMMDYVQINDPINFTIDERGRRCMILTNKNTLCWVNLLISTSEEKYNAIYPYLPQSCYEFIYNKFNVTCPDNKLYIMEKPNPILLKCMMDLEHIQLLLNQI